jgi:hypothetical protein
VLRPDPAHLPAPAARHLPRANVFNVHEEVRVYKFYARYGRYVTKSPLQVYIGITYPVLRLSRIGEETP